MAEQVENIDNQKPDAAETTVTKAEETAQEVGNKLSTESTKEAYDHMLKKIEESAGTDGQDLKAKTEFKQALSEQLNKEGEIDFSTIPLEWTRRAQSKVNIDADKQTISEAELRAFANQPVDGFTRDMALKAADIVKNEEGQKISLDDLNKRLHHLDQEHIDSSAKAEQEKQFRDDSDHLLKPLTDGDIVPGANPALKNYNLLQLADTIGAGHGEPDGAVSLADLTALQSSSHFKSLQTSQQKYVDDLVNDWAGNNDRVKQLTNGRSEIEIGDLTKRSVEAENAAIENVQTPGERQLEESENSAEPELTDNQKKAKEVEEFLAQKVGDKTILELAQSIGNRDKGVAGIDIQTLANQGELYGLNSDQVAKLDEMAKNWDSLDNIGVLKQDGAFGWKFLSEESIAEGTGEAQRQRDKEKMESQEQKTKAQTDELGENRMVADDFATKLSSLKVGEATLFEAVDEQGSNNPNQAITLEEIERTLARKSLGLSPDARDALELIKNSWNTEAMRLLKGNDDSITMRDLDVFIARRPTGTAP